MSVSLHHEFNVIVTRMMVIDVAGFGETSCNFSLCFLCAVFSTVGATGSLASDEFVINASLQLTR